MYLSDLLHINIHWTNLTHLHPISEYCIVFFSPKKLTTKVLKKYVFIRVPAMIYCYKLIQSIFSSRNTVLSNGNSDIYWWGVLLLGEMRSLNLLRLLYKRQACLPTKPCVRSKKHVLKKSGKFKHFFSQRKLIHIWFVDNDIGKTYSTNSILTLWFYKKQYILRTDCKNKIASVTKYCPKASVIFLQLLQARVGRTLR